MAFGKPVFLSNNTSLPEIGGPHAFYWNHYEPEYMATIVKKGLALYQENPTELSLNYRVHANSFNWDTSARQYSEVYRSLL